jgi:hypothetical protein
MDEDEEVALLKDEKEDTSEEELELLIVLMLSLVDELLLLELDVALGIGCKMFPNRSWRYSIASMKASRSLFRCQKVCREL